MRKQRRLGRGLDALLASRNDSVADADSTPESLGTVQTDLDALRPGRYQPRQQIAEESLAELAESIREQGLLQPLIVRIIEPAHGDPGSLTYEIVAGERRWRAAKLAGLTTVPVVVRELDDQSALAVALIENLQREDLNPIDQARSLSRLAVEFELTHEQAAKAVGRSRASVSNLLRLLDLHDDVKALLANGKLDMGHARAMLPLDATRQVAMARKTQTKGWSVRQVEKAVRDQLAAPTDDANAKRSVDLQTRWLQQQIAAELGQKITIRPGKDGNYSLNIGFGDLPQLQDALDRIRTLIGQIHDTAGPRVRNSDQ